MRICWFVPNDKGGGVISVALSCCRQSVAAGHDVTLLLVRPSTGWVEEYATFPYESLGKAEDGHDVPRRLTAWLDEHPQDVIFFNDCSQAHEALPYIPDTTRSVMVVHDTARRYWKPAVEYENVLDAVGAVSDVVARQFRDRLDTPEKLYLLHNGTVFPSRDKVKASDERADDLLFLGGDKAFKGATDLLAVWRALAEKGFGGCLHWYGTVSPSFQRKIRALPDSDRIKVHGRVPRSTIFERAGVSKVLLMLSRSEPFGMVTIEGMGMGAVPVAWDIESGTKEIVEAGDTGFFAPLGDAETLAIRIREACRRHEVMYENAVNVARTRFSEEAMWKRYRRFLTELDQRTPVRRPKAGQTPPDHEPPTRYFQLLPEGIRSALRAMITRSPSLSYWLRHFRGY
jgi:glycosyltransferase involved in cell wall biosynthesis